MLFGELRTHLALNASALKTFQLPLSALHGAEITQVRRYGKFLAIDGSGTWLVFRPQRLGDDSAAFDDLLHPLPDGAVTVRDGHWLGYDPAAGLYRMELAGERGSLSFEEAWRNAGARLAMGIRLASDGGVPPAAGTDPAGEPFHAIAAKVAAWLTARNK